ncbi:hypothetical protein Lesp02_68940 [Lentzea sp. NBRC 105346]|uniref:glycine-rich domain-containing protein n=1 Tax=Lentzea sp. NBRC 105346 TaxID=3032205 RepID=UPI0024A3CF37|nr:hypothetical protein [Lentzea sp. NBRC 105346]GLZ34707.1 hypothetical protein Lesp02_68940 [Lentzea sp. NBRC 105346]
MTVQQAHRLGRSLVPIALFDRLTDRISADHGFEPALAARVMDQALVFLKACADRPGAPLSPSWLVDVGWHTFLLYTRDYAEFCDRVAGRFIHHVPTDGPGGTTLDHTIEAIGASGFAVDPELWEGATSKCDTDKCHGCASGCHDDPPPIPPYRAA